MKIRIGFNGSFTGLLYSAGEWTFLSICKPFSTVNFPFNRLRLRSRLYVHQWLRTWLLRVLHSAESMWNVGEEQLARRFSKKSHCKLSKHSLMRYLLTSCAKISIRKISCGTLWRFSTIHWLRKSSTSISKSRANTDMIFGRLWHFHS